MESWLDRRLSSLLAHGGGARPSRYRRRQTRLLWSTLGVSLLLAGFAFALATLHPPEPSARGSRDPEVAALELPPAAEATLAAATPAPER